MPWNTDIGGDDIMGMEHKTASKDVGNCYSPIGENGK